MSSLQYEELSKGDVELITSELYPKAKRSLMFSLAAMLLLSFLLPFVPGKRSNKSAIETMGYPGAFITYVFIFACIGLYFYRKSVLGLRRDLKSGNKCVFKTRVSKKVWHNDQQFELKLEEHPKVFSKKKFFYPVVESHCFHEGDMVVIEYLERSEVQLRMF